MKRKAADDASACSSSRTKAEKKAAKKQMEEKLNTWKDSVYENAQKTLEKDMPPKIVELDQLYDHEDFASAWPLFNADDYKAQGDDVPNRQLADRIEKASIRLKMEARIFLTSIVNVKMWVQLNMPKIEDGGQFGLEVQEEMVEQVQAGEDLACTIAEEVSRFFGGRGKMVAKRVKYPNCEDYARCLWEMDIRRVMNLRKRLRQLRNAYLMVLDVFGKNSKYIVTDRQKASTHMNFLA